MTQKTHIRASKIHKWLALFIGAQLLLWFASGVIMSVVPIDTVRSEHLVAREPEKLKSLDGLVKPQGLAREVSGNVVSLRYRSVLGRPVAELENGRGETFLYDAKTGIKRSQITSEEARSITSRAWIAGRPNIAAVEEVVTGSTEYRGALPAWRVDTDDDVSVYIPLSTGEIAAVRSTTWRIYDFFWGLHIMDWKNHENFNSWWLVLFALGGLTMALSGLFLLIKRWPFRRKRKDRNLYTTHA